MNASFALWPGQSTFKHKTPPLRDSGSSIGESFCSVSSAWLASKPLAHSSHCFPWNVVSCFSVPQFSIWETQGWVSPGRKANTPFRTTSGNFVFGGFVLTLMSERKDLRDESESWRDPRRKTRIFHDCSSEPNQRRVIIRPIRAQKR